MVATTVATTEAADVASTVVPLATAVRGATTTTPANSPDGDATKADVPCDDGTSATPVSPLLVACASSEDGDDIGEAHRLGGRFHTLLATLIMSHRHKLAALQLLVHHGT